MLKITNTKTKKFFYVNSVDNILEQALNHGLNYPYGCTKGTCGKCKAKIIAGDFVYHKENLSGIKDYETDNFALLCQAHALSDITLAIDEIASNISVKNFIAQVTKVDKLTHDVLRLVVQTQKRIAFLAGQYVDISYGDFAPKSFSIANRPGSYFLEFHIKIIKGGAFTNFLFNKLKVGDILKMSGPKGDFYLRTNNSKDILLVAGGTGFAPIKAILEQLRQNNYSDKIIFYWGVKDISDLYLNFDEIFNDYPIDFIPVLSKNNAKWSGKTGMVHQVVLTDITNFNRFVVYACGPPPMVQSVATSFLARGLTQDSFFSDSFEFNLK